MKILKFKSSVYKRILGIFGAAGFLVTFQACYGTPQNYVSIRGSVKDVNTGEGINDLQVSISSDTDSTTVQTDEEGNFDYTVFGDGDINVSVVDVDGETNGVYSNFDTIVSNENHILDININEN